MHSVTKLCADHLRVFSSNCGVKLKSSHAHELFAAFSGYKSKAAMLADTFAPIENLALAQFLVLTPSLFIDQRRKCLQDLPPTLPDTDKLCEELAAFLEHKISGKFFASWQHLSETLTKRYLKKHSARILPTNFVFYDPNASEIFNKPLREFNPKIEIADNGVKLIVNSEYCSSPNVRFHLKSIVVNIAINLQRIAGYIGFANAEISLIDCSSETFSQAGTIG